MTLQKQVPLGSGLGVVLLGAGNSSRMARPKLLLPWGNTTVIGSLVGQWQLLGVDQITVVIRPEDTLLAAELDRIGLPVASRIPNPHAARGMFTSVLAAANWPGWRPGLDSWVIALGDQPHLRQGMLGELLAFGRENRDQICQPEFGNRTRHPVILPRAVFEGLKQSSGPTLGHYLEGSACGVARLLVEDPGLALDLDWPEDYDRMRELGLTRTPRDG